jgi:glycogen debranching enzyme
MPTPRAAAEDRFSHQRVVQPTVVKQGSIFLLCTDLGDIQADSDQGLYFNDMRYLSAESLRLDGQAPVVLLADASDGYRAVFELTNPRLKGARKETLGVRREKCLGDGYTQTLTIENYAASVAELSLQLNFAADFADMFVVRGLPRGQRGKLRTPRWRGRSLTFAYDGVDGHARAAALHFSHTPHQRRAGELTFRLKLRPHVAWRLTVRCDLADRAAGQPRSTPPDSEGAGDEDRDRARGGRLGPGAQAETSNTLFNEVLGRSFMDLHMLRMRQQDDTFFAAGVPWYVALFGRDTLITSIQVSAFEPEIGAKTLRVLASHQGQKIDDDRDEQPGKILHELRVDEMANLDEIPQTPYYGSVDSTPLFLVLLGVYSAWEGSLDLFRELRDNVCAGLSWIDRFGDNDGDGFVDYQTRSSRGGRNQGWKDSANGIVMHDGSLAAPPIALPEVQGDVYLAWRLMADLFERDGDTLTAERLCQQAQDLFTRFNREFWLPRQRYYAFCRAGGGRFSTSIASNAAHALWTGIVDPRRAPDVARRILQPDMFSGWGVRTLSAEDRSYNPVDYQVGSVWPHDNALIVAGLQRYGFDDAANQVFTAMTQAATRFEHFRLPEVFAGYDRSFASQPVKYPVACNPQAWAAGSVPFMLSSVLGLQPNAFERRLRIRRPRLPDWLDWVTLRGLRVGQAEVDLEYRRSEQGTLVAVTRKQGDLLVSVES